MVKTGINTHMIVLAREARGLAQNELAERIGMSATNLSKIERGDIGISDEVLEAIADATGYPPHFFEQEGAPVPEHLAYRKRQVVAQKLLTPITARANILRRHVQFLTRALAVEIPLVPHLALGEGMTPEQAAARLRKLWKIDTPLIANLTRTVEEQGIAVAPFDFGTERVDSRSMLTEDGYPIIFLNRTLLGDRLRFSLAYELGQLVLHTGVAVGPERDIVSEANAFAAALLLPGKEVRQDLEEGVTVARLAQLKKKWKVSMIALLYRADDLGLLTPNQKRYLLQQFNSAGIRRREPPELDVAIEEPRLVKRWLADYRARTRLGTVELAAVLHLNVDEYLELYS
jgi:Zn-dependent peptidase ImmA (M78 family)/transcriptional regulator with XRE-family HTH domain